MKPIEQQIDGLVPEWTELFKALKKHIGDEYRARDDDTLPGMCVTIGFTPAADDTAGNITVHKPARWNYQTGDNSYTGGAYGHPHWAVVSLYRRSNCRELAEDCANQIADLVCQ